MSNMPVDATLSILELPSVLTDLFERAQRPLLPGSQGPLGLFVRYFRRKSGRGLAVIYAVDELGSKTHAHDPKRAVSLTLDEQALDGAHIRFTATQAHAAPVEVQPSGVLRASTLGISVQAFPADGGLPALAASCDTTPGGPVFEALQAAAQVQLRDTAWHLFSASAEPVRYKPANRCVIRYSLLLEHSQQSGTQEKLTIFGKVYAEPEQARSVQALQQQLYVEQEQSGELPLLPRPLGIIDSLGLTFNEAVQPAVESPADGRWVSLRTGSRALQPQLKYGRGGVITQVLLPDEELRLTAQALARLHTSTVHPDEAPRTGAKEAKRAHERAALIAGRNAEQAEEVQRLAQELATRLNALQPEQYRPAHGGFKASQLLLHSHRAFVVDFDGFCLADPALDVGYFLAYLRPSGLWYSRPGMRQWFEAAAEVFRSTYRQAMLAHSVAASSIDSTLKRSRLYEAALIFKIATRRVNRLNSPRPHELSTMLSEITLCLSD